jgi:hypothetical protein
MKRPLRHPTALVGLIALGAAVFTSSQIGDYVLDQNAAENPAPALQALAEGSVSRFVDLHPVMGSFSLVLRAPVVALSDLLGGGHLLGYRLGVLICFIPALVVGSWLAREVQARDRGRLEAIASGVLVVVNPITLDATRSGHPEEVLGGALGVLAVVCAARGRSLQAAVALGLAIGTKQWTLLAVLPALFAAPARTRRSIALVAGVVGIVLALSAPLADWGNYRAKTHALGATTIVSRYSVWSTVSRQVDIVVPGFDKQATIHRLPLGLSRQDIGPVIPIVCSVIVLAFAWRRRWRLREEEAMALLAISFLLRGTLDSTVLLYYFAPMVLALAWWEVRRRGIPLGTAAATAFIWQLFSHADELPETLSVVLFLSGCAAICGYAARPLFGRAVPGNQGLTSARAGVLTPEQSKLG